MTVKQIKNWYWILTFELLFASFLFLFVSFFAEILGIGGNWGMGRILIAALGFILGFLFVILWFPRFKVIAQSYKVAQFTRYLTESTMWILVAFGCCELILQTTMLRIPEIIYEKDWGGVPVSGSIRFLGKEGFGITHYLAHGEIETPFDEGAVSVVVLGDSHTEAAQVSDEEKYVSIAEVSIRSKGGVVDLHNLGLSANSIPDYIYFAPIIKQYYQPEIVVIQLSPQDFFGGTEGESFNPKKRNYFGIDKLGGLELRHSDQFATGSYNKLYNKLRIMIPLLGLERYSQIAEKINVKSNSTDQAPLVHASGTDERMDDQLKLLKEAYLGTKVVLLLLPYTPNIDKNNINFDDPEYQQLLESAEKIGNVYIINPQLEFDQLIKQGHLPRGFMNSLPGVGHFNIFGNRIIGELLAGKISEIAQ